LRQAARITRDRPFTWRPRIFRSWCSGQEHAAGVLESARGLSAADKLEIEQWLQKASDFGYTAICKRVADGPENLIEVYGPLELVPTAIVYPEGDHGYVFEGFDGEIRETMSLCDALDFVRNR
jgi:hypothetical protein